MVSKKCILLILTLMVFQLSFSENNAEKATKYFTGNSRVDFFSSTVKFLNNIYVNQSPEIEVTDGISKKSPLLAGGLSIIVPGAGEIYNGDYVKAGMFIAVEAAAWVFSSYYNNKGDDVTNIFQNFADERTDSRPAWDNTESDRYRTKWDVIRYYEWTNNNKSIINPQGDYTDLQNAITSNDKTLPPWQRVDWNSLNELERRIGKWYSHSLPQHGEQQYYELIGKYQQFNQGWDDAVDSLFTYGKPVTANFLFYSQMRGIANDYYYKAKAAAVVIVANHILSAVDAYFTARYINSNLSTELRMENQETPFGKIPVTFGTVKYHF
jgi:hypothetical protein